MAKKTFKGSPAMQFITGIGEETPLAEKPAPVREAAKKPDTVAAPPPVEKTPPAPKSPRPAARETTPGAQKPAVEKPARSAPPQAPAGVPVKLNPMYIETRSKRLQLLMQPSLHAKLKSVADGKGQSLNDLIHQVLEEFCDE